MSRTGKHYLCFAFKAYPSTVVLKPVRTGLCLLQSKKSLKVNVIIQVFQVNANKIEIFDKNSILIFHYFLHCLQMTEK
jgi:hypothetical protein